MRDDIPTLLRDAAAEPSYSPDFDALAARGRWQHLAVSAGTVLITVVVLVAGGLALWRAPQPARGPVIGDQATTPDQAENAAAIPPGWHEIRLGGAIFGVPADWIVETLSEPAGVCPNTAEQPTAYVLHAGPASESGPCVTIAPRALTVQAASLSDVPASHLKPDDGRHWKSVRTSNGVKGQRLIHGDSGLVVAYRFPTLDLWLRFADAEPMTEQVDDILATVTTTSSPEASGTPSP